jgi:hypothetical protein
MPKPEISSDHATNFHTASEKLRMAIRDALPISAVYSTQGAP